MELTYKQSQSMTPQMIQAIKILQMDSLELLSELRLAAEENPVLEIEEQHSQQDEFDLLPQKLEWLRESDWQNVNYYHQDEEAWQNDGLSRYAKVEEESLSHFLIAQLSSKKLSEKLFQAAVLLVESLDQSGWIDEDLSQLAEAAGVGENLLLRALTVVQSLEPAGVGGRGLAECLSLQLRRYYPENTLAVAIAEHYLDAVAKNQYGLIAKKAGVTHNAVREACDLIRTLDPRPCAAFSQQGPSVYTIPDITVIDRDGDLEVLTNHSFYPSLRINGYYEHMLRENSDDEVKDYLSQKMRQAKWLMRSVEQRKTTVLNCAKAIVYCQSDFFHFHRGPLVPMSLADVAEKVGVHESTVSRAVKGKFLQCSRGAYPLSFFFSRRIGLKGQAVTAEGAKALLKQIIAAEEKPLSDQKLCGKLAEAGCVLSRRTVAKYREELGIPNATGRRGTDKFPT